MALILTPLCILIGSIWGYTCTSFFFRNLFFTYRNYYYFWKFRFWLIKWCQREWSILAYCYRPPVPSITVQALPYVGTWTFNQNKTRRRITSVLSHSIQQPVWLPVSKATSVFHLQFSWHSNSFNISSHGEIVPRLPAQIARAPIPTSTESISEYCSHSPDVGNCTMHTLLLKQQHI